MRTSSGAVISHIIRRISVRRELHRKYCPWRRGRKEGAPQIGDPPLPSHQELSNSRFYFEFEEASKMPGFAGSDRVELDKHNRHHRQDTCCTRRLTLLLDLGTLRAWAGGRHDKLLAVLNPELRRRDMLVDPRELSLDSCSGLRLIRIRELRPVCGHVRMECASDGEPFGIETEERDILCIILTPA